MIRCLYDGCCEFEPNTHNHRYCNECKCKRKEEARKRIYEKPLIYDEETFQLEEERKKALSNRRQAKSDWILENKTFASFDIESTGLDANGDELLCACIKPINTPAMKGSLKVKTFVSDIYRPEGGDDYSVLNEIRDELRNYDYIVTWYGTRFDMPFLATRLLLTEQEPLGEARHLDLFYSAKFSYKFSNNRLQTVEEALFDGKTLKTRLSRPIWKQAQSFNYKKRKKALDYIIEHCEHDVISLENIFYELENIRNLDRIALKKY